MAQDPGRPRRHRRFGRLRRPFTSPRRRHVRDRPFEERHQPAGRLAPWVGGAAAQWLQDGLPSDSARSECLRRPHLGPRQMGTRSTSAVASPPRSGSLTTGRALARAVGRTARASARRPPGPGEGRSTAGPPLTCGAPPQASAASRSQGLAPAGPGWPVRGAQTSPPVAEPVETGQRVVEHQLVQGAVQSRRPRPRPTSAGQRPRAASRPRRLYGLIVVLAAVFWLQSRSTPAAATWSSSTRRGPDGPR